LCIAIRQSAPAAAASVAVLRLSSTPLSHPMVTGAELKQQDNFPADSQKQPKDCWPAPCEQQPLSSQEALDGFKLQARELRRRRAAELRRINRTAPYNSTQTTFLKANQPSSQPNTQNIIPLSEPTNFGIITVMPPPDLTSEALQSGESPAKVARASNAAQTKLPPIQFKRVNSNPSPNSYKVDTNQAPQNNTNGTRLGAQQQPIWSHLNFQSSVNSHLSLLQPNESHVSHQVSKEDASSDVQHHAPLDGENLPLE
jgi:hypothetical protein